MFPDVIPSRLSKVMLSLICPGFTSGGLSMILKIKRRITNVRTRAINGQWKLMDINGDLSCINPHGD